MMTVAALLLSLATAGDPLSGKWSCVSNGNVIAGAVRTQTGESSINASKPEDFRYGDFSFQFEGDTVVIRLRVADKQQEQRTSYFRQKNYATFNYNLGLVETGYAQPITFWTNEAGLDKARYEVSFPSVSLRVMKTISGAEVYLGDGAMAVAALSCTKRASE